MAAGDRWLTSGEFSRRSELSAKALRLYDRIGLLRPAEVEAGNGYRRYHESQLYTARLIALLRRLDMPLIDIAAIVAARGPDAAALLDTYWADVEQRLARQRALADRLVRSLTDDAAPPTEGWRIAHRHVPEQTVLTEQRHVRASELNWIDAATDRLAAAAARAGGATGPRFVVFHSRVTEDSAGPVEVCLPIDRTRVDDTLASRPEPAHREAYVPVLAGHFETPRILSVYDALHRWVRATGHRSVAAPREVYRYPAEPGSPVCDVAMPYA